VIGIIADVRDFLVDAHLELALEAVGPAVAEGIILPEPLAAR
jgi:hypothetical protein